VSARGRPAGVPVRLAACAKTFADGTRALEPVDLAIGAGETVVFLGPSGCGKTTLLRLVAGLEDPDPGGRVLFGEDDVTAVPIERRNVGMVFQSYALFPNMTVAGNVEYGLKVRGMDRADRRARVEEMLAMVRLTELAHRPVDQLSGGQRQRVALARAIAVRPRVLLLDEPLTALDARLRDELRDEIDRLLRALGVTAVYVTHDQAEAMALGDRIVVMSRGRVAQVGTPREVYDRPADAFVADFVGTMNRIPARVEAGALRLPGAAPVAWDGPDRIVEALVRPEAVRLADAPDGAEPLEGRIVSAMFLGDRIRLTIDAGPPRPLVVETADRRPLAPGDAVRLTVDAARALVL